MYVERYGSRGWLAVEGRAGRLYLATLAAAICESSGGELFPITDQPSYFSEMANPSRIDSALRLDRIRAAVLKDVLPHPVSAIPANELADFKEKHFALARAFRLEVESELVRIASEPNGELRDELAHLARERLLAGADELRARMTERRWPTAAASACAALAGVPMAAGALASNKPELLPTAAVPLLTEIVRSRLTRSPMTDLPAAYAVAAANAFL